MGEVAALRLGRELCQGCAACLCRTDCATTYERPEPFGKVRVICEVIQGPWSVLVDYESHSVGMMDVCGTVRVVEGDRPIRN